LSIGKEERTPKAAVAAVTASLVVVAVALSSLA
jgi:hypothetical protein